MNKSLSGRFLLWFGVFLSVLWLFRMFTSRLSPSPMLLVFGLGLILAGRFLQGKLAPREVSPPSPPVPFGFNPTYAHDNIAFDVSAKQVWLREGDRSRVFARSDILGWQVEYGTVKAPDMYSGGVINRGTEAKTSIRLAVQTKDMEHPVYRVRFARRNRWLNSEGNHADAVAWSNRLTAFMNS